MIKIIICLIVILPTNVLFANNNRDEKALERVMIVNLQSRQDRGLDNNQNDENNSNLEYGEQISPITDKEKDSYEDIVIANILLNNSKINLNNKSANLFKVTDVESIEKIRIEKEKLLIAKNKEELTKSLIKQSTDEEIHLTGLCSVRKPIEIKLMPSYSTLKCYFDANKYNIDEGNMLVNIIPYPKYEALIGNSIYFKTKDNKKYNVLSGIVMTADMNNLNIATWFDNNQFTQIFTKEAINANNEVYEASKKYLEAKQASDIQQTISYPSNAIGTTTPIQTTNTQKPNISDYIISSGINIATSITNAILRANNDNTKKIWGISKYTQLYVDFTAISSLNKNFKMKYRVEESMLKTNSNKTNSNKME